MSSTPMAPLPDDYAQLLESLKLRVRQAQATARRTVNTELIGLYWSIGHEILVRQDRQGWGAGVVRRLADDLRTEFPSMTGLSLRNLQYMRTMVESWGSGANAPQAVAHLPWGHIRTILDKTQTPQQRQGYAAAAVEHGWSRNVLLNMIMGQAMERTGSAPSNFAELLPSPGSELAQQAAKDPYNFEFLGLTGEVAERDLEQRLTDQIVQTLRELGPGFAFVGRQVPLDVDGDEYRIDLLFFHVEQLRYYVIELKTGKFQVEYAGKLNFYVAVVDDQLRRPFHHETVGILICGSKNDHTVRYSLGRSTSPMAVAAYTYDQLPLTDQELVPAEGQITAALDALPDDEVTPD